MSDIFLLSGSLTVEILSRSCRDHAEILSRNVKILSRSCQLERLQFAILQFAILQYAILQFGDFAICEVCESLQFANPAPK